MHSSFIETIRIQRDRRITSWVALLIGIVFLALPFVPSRIGGTGSVCIAGFGLVVVGLTYLGTARYSDWKMERYRDCARFICGLCVAATIIILVLENTPT